VDDLAARIEGVFVPVLITPAPIWFDGNAVAARDRLLLDALASCISDEPVDPFPPVTFAHLLGASLTASARFIVAPLAVPGYEGTVRDLERSSATEARGAAFRAVYDTAGWDRSVAQNAPGQSGSPSSPHFRDLAAPWAAGEYFPLAYTDAAVQTNLETTLTLVPR
jgi:penicillin amidase